MAGVRLRRTFAALGLGYLLTTLAPFVFPAWRGLERPGPPAATAQPAPASAVGPAR